MPVFLPVDSKPPEPPHVHGVDSEYSYKETIRGASELDSTVESLLFSYEFPQKLIPLDAAGTLLRLWEPLVLHVDSINDEFRVEEWDIKDRCDNVHTLPEQLARKFIEYFGKSEQGRLTETEQKLWLKILDTVDYQHFSIQRAPAHYMEGLVHRNGQGIRVEWMDGTKERLKPEVAAPLSFLQDGDEFSAYCKLGLDNEVISIERVTLLVS